MKHWEILKLVQRFTCPLLKGKPMMPTVPLSASFSACGAVELSLVVIQRLIHLEPRDASLRNDVPDSIISVTIQNSVIPCSQESSYVIKTEVSGWVIDTWANGKGVCAGSSGACAESSVSNKWIVLYSSPSYKYFLGYTPMFGCCIVITSKDADNINNRIMCEVKILWFNCLIQTAKQLVLAST